jgi:putative membrane protein
MLAALAAVGLLLPAVLAQRDKTEKKPDAEALTDQQFVMKASAADLAEINLGRVAARQASDPAVKQFAQRLVDDHTKASADLLRIANKRSLPAARTMDAQHRQLQTRLLNLKGADFDRAYLTQQVDDHKKAVALFEAASKTAKDPDLKAFAAKTLPTIRDHLKMAQDLAGKLKGGKGGSGR